MACTETAMDPGPFDENARLCTTLAGLETARSPWDPRAVPGIPFAVLVMCASGFVGVKVVQRLAGDRHG